MLIKKLSIARLSVVAFVLLIIAGSSVPGRKIPKAFELTPDKLIHFAEYFVFGYLLFNWAKIEFVKWRTRNIMLITLLLGTIMGIIDENYQRLTPGRTPDFWDWVLDTIGIILAMGFVKIFSRQQSLK
jgi:VanZ family protein